MNVLQQVSYHDTKAKDVEVHVDGDHSWLNIGVFGESPQTTAHFRSLEEFQLFATSVARLSKEIGDYQAAKAADMHEAEGRDA